MPVSLPHRTTAALAVVFIAVAVAISSGCADAPTYELHWTIDCQPGQSTCEPRSTKGCSAVGLDSVEVLALQGGDLFASIFPCFSLGEGPVGRGPELEPGSVSLEVYGLSPGGIRLTDVVQASATIPDSGRVKVEVNLPRPAQCRDGVDNNGNGLVDLLDPGCTDSEDPDETADEATSDGGPADVGLADVGTADAGTADGGPAEIGPSEGGTTDVGTADVGTADVGTADGGTADGGTVDGGTADVGTADVGTADGGTADVGTADVGTADVGTADVGTADGGPADVGPADVGTTDGGPADVDPVDGSIDGSV